MKLKEIIKFLDKNLPFKMYEYVSKKQGEDITFFSAFSDNDKKTYLSKIEDQQKEFISNSAYIALPDISVDEFYEKFNCDFGVVYDFTMNRISCLISDIKYEEKKLAFCIYIILHEVGHWKNFEELGRKPYYYSRQDEKMRKKYYNIRFQLEEYGKLLSENDIKDEYIEKVRRYIEGYNNIPIEEKANEYADKNIKIIMDKIR